MEKLLKVFFLYCTRGAGREERSKINKQQNSILFLNVIRRFSLHLLLLSSWLLKQISVQFDFFSNQRYWAFLLLPPFFTLSFLCRIIGIDFGWARRIKLLRNITDFYTIFFYWDDAMDGRGMSLNHCGERRQRFHQFLTFSLCSLILTSQSLRLILYWFLFFISSTDLWWNFC